jgi:hypothetical protein
VKYLNDLAAETEKTRKDEQRHALKQALTAIQAAEYLTELLVRVKNGNLPDLMIPDEITFDTVKHFERIKYDLMRFTK